MLFLMNLKPGIRNLSPTPGFPIKEFGNDTPYNPELYVKTP